MHRVLLLTFVLLPALAGCADWPDLPPAPEAALSREPPALLPIDAVLGVDVADNADPAAGVEARAAALRSRAAILSAPVDEAGDLDTIRGRLTPPE